MSLRVYEPWKLLDQWQRDMQHAVARQTDEDNISDWTPAVDIREEDERYLIHADLPGINAKDIDVSMEDNVLTISGKRHSEYEEKKDQYHRVERLSGIFQRRFTLPKDADSSKIAATSKDGVLELSIPKTEGSISRKIEVQG
ncbi:MAG: Hsp20/alpha crystallin family protein [gamma proteobacterium symbiont of Bathyaustriella thionipta]|nr:Hsp20/alpha crystallin family protein [gamma proteobacterium symbiont of Bathyaustriella thionipta]